MMQKSAFGWGFLVGSALIIHASIVTAQVKVACIGNSITQGDKRDTITTTSYPWHLQKVLGSGYTVRNFGKSGATAVTDVKQAYTKTPQFADALAFAPEIVIIKLGTNDSKPYVTDSMPTRFMPCLDSICGVFMALPSVKKVFLCLPVPVFQDKFTIRGKVVKKVIVPAVREVAKGRKLEVIDLNKPFRRHPEYFYDGIHPNTAGAQQIAAVVGQSVVGYTTKAGVK